MPPSTPNLLGLPVEVRQQIWSYVKHSELNVQACHCIGTVCHDYSHCTSRVARQGLVSAPSWPLLRVSRQLHVEFLPLPAYEMAFTFCSHHCAIEASRGCTWRQKAKWKTLYLCKTTDLPARLVSFDPGLGEMLEEVGRMLARMDTQNLQWQFGDRKLSVAYRCDKIHDGLQSKETAFEIA